MKGQKNHEIFQQLFNYMSCSLTLRPTEKISTQQMVIYKRNLLRKIRPLSYRSENIAFPPKPDIQTHGRTNSYRKASLGTNKKSVSVLILFYVLIFLCSEEWIHIVIEEKHRFYKYCNIDTVLCIVFLSISTCIYIILV